MLDDALAKCRTAIDVEHETIAGILVCRRSASVLRQSQRSSIDYDLIPRRSTIYHRGENRHCDIITSARLDRCLKQILKHVNAGPSFCYEFHVLDVRHGGSRANRHNVTAKSFRSQTMR